MKKMTIIVDFGDYTVRIYSVDPKLIMRIRNGERFRLEMQHPEYSETCVLVIPGEKETGIRGVKEAISECKMSGKPKKRGKKTFKIISVDEFCRMKLTPKEKTFLKKKDIEMLEGIINSTEYIREYGRPKVNK